jgi:hypothetical protein
MMSGGEGVAGYDSITASRNFQVGGPQILGLMSDLVDMVGRIFVVILFWRMSKKATIQIKRLQENLVSRESLIRTLKAENLRLNRETAGVRRALKVPVISATQSVKKKGIKRKLVKK